MYEVSSRDVSFVFDLDLLPWPRICSFRMTFKLWPSIKTTLFSGHHKGENVFIRSYVPLKHGFHDKKNHIFKPPKYRKWVRTKIDTLEREFKDSAVNVFSGGQNAQGELSQCLIRVLPWPLTLAANLVFSHDHELKLTFSGRHKGANVLTQSYELL